MTADQFREQYGDPEGFRFLGQCYDAGRPTTICGVCRRRIRFCFIAFAPAAGKLTFGSCCFRHFQGSRLAPLLEASQLLLLNTVMEAMKAGRKAKEAAELRTAQQGWKAARREAQKRIRAYKRATGKEWLPEPLFDLSVAVEAPEPQHKHSQSATRWFLAKTGYLRKKMAEFAVPTGTIAHEINAHHQG